MYFDARKEDRLVANAMSRLVVQASNERGLRDGPYVGTVSLELGRRFNEGMGNEMGVRASVMEGVWPRVGSEEPNAGSGGLDESGI